MRTAAEAIVADVRAGGDAAVRAHTARLDRVELPADYAVPASELRAALEALSPGLREALEMAAANIRAYHEREAVAPWRETLAQGQVVGQQVVPLAAAGLYVPGGLADYPSSVLMTAIPAQVAGVERIVVCSPPRPGGGAAAGVAAACALLGVERLYPVGGAQAVAAMALGTACVPRCDVIVGPGNAYVTEAKTAAGRRGRHRQPRRPERGAHHRRRRRRAGVAGRRPARPGRARLRRHGLPRRHRRYALRSRHGRPSSASPPSSVSPRVTSSSSACPDREAALALSNAFAPEHLELHCAQAGELLAGVRNAGAVFVGPHAATAFADYAAGTNHVLPTGGSARFGQGLSTDAFRKRVAVVELDASAAAALARPVATIAEEEGLRAHALSARLRAQ